MLQLEKRGSIQPSMILAHTILNAHFEEFSKRHYDKIVAKLGITETELKAAIDEVLRLNPKPRGVYSDPFNKTSQPIIPDFVLELSEVGFDLHLNSRNLPELRLSNAYSEMLHSYSKDKSQKKELKEAVLFVLQKIDSAKWFIML